MSSKPKANTARGVAALIKDGNKGVYSAGEGLYLKVNGENVGSWLYRYQLDGKRRKIGLGSYDGVTLSEARILANNERNLVAKGIDPQEHREEQERLKQAKRVTFDSIAADYIEAHRSSWTNAKHAQQWENTLKTYASPVIGDLTPQEIKTEHILEILKPIWETKNETASRVRNRIELVLNAAKVRRLRTGENVAAWRGHLELLLPKRKRSSVRHHPALSWREIGAFWQSLIKDQSASSQALQLTILTATRTSEVLNAHWREFDLKNKVWTIPAERMKAGREQRIPLSSAALTVLEQIPQVVSGLLFEGRTEGKPLNNMAMIMKARRMDKAKTKADGKGWKDSNGETITPHGFRSTFRDWAAEATSFENIVVEQALAHTIGNAVEAAYRRGDLLERRRQLMEAWAQHINETKKNNVVSLHA
ncbi:integrase arm-type DNA-binding domain-containing protein [Ignatzschineria sp. RMDPL8A]|uniref:tyrosine-type recombinase/integrase n=1 Tax=Ignatzschineria sp. RMDPL8A TaxID=2999236 RepID=UPI0024466CD9|nr:site-specific integrase [Ignatzschineria sp. RMDPL8A]MDG9729093.1 integrase arm-type DNA-binding domain-containing protein [Ignatzschineria sp. RMDPL8A]